MSPDPEETYAINPKNFETLPIGHGDENFEFDVVHVEAQAIGEDPCGEVHSGILELRGRLKHVFIRRVKSRNEDEYFPMIFTDEEGLAVESQTFFPDAGNSALLRDIGLTAKPAVCMLAMLIDEPGYHTRMAFVFEPVTGQTNTFRRIGMANFHHYTGLPDERPPGKPSSLVSGWRSKRNPKQTLRII